MVTSRVSASVNTKSIRYVLIRPCWTLLVVVTKGSMEEVMDLGPAFSNQFWSTTWVAIAWPRVSVNFGGRRCIIDGK